MTLPDKTDQPLRRPDTPDFSVAVLDFESGVVARLTCSIAAPVDHRMRIIGNRGEISADTYRDYEAPVRLDPFRPMPLKARNAAAIRRHSVLQWPFGIGGRRLPLIRTAGREQDELAGGGFRGWLRRRRRAQFGQQDKCLGLAELASAIAEDRPHFPAAEFTLHLTDLTLAIQGAGPDGCCYRPKTTFTPLALPAQSRAAAPDFAPFSRPSSVPAALARLLGGLKARST